MSKTALIIVDVQNDFLPEGPDRPRGSLAVPDGDQVVPIISQLLGDEWEWDLIIATQVSLAYYKIQPAILIGRCG